MRTRPRLLPAVLSSSLRAIVTFGVPLGVAGLSAGCQQSLPAADGGDPGGPADLSAPAAEDGPAPADLPQAPPDLRPPPAARTLDFDAVRNHPEGEMGVVGKRVIGDVNGDGAPDVLFANTMGSGVYLLLGDGKGAFAAPKTIDLRSPWEMTLGDVNGDGKLDLVNLPYEYLGPTGVLLGRGDGTFAAPVYSGSNDTPTSPLLVDWSGDGKPDLVYGQGLGKTQVLLRRGDGAGAFTSPPTAHELGVSTRRLLLADVDGDGKKDLIAVARDLGLAMSTGAGFAAASKLSVPLMAPGWTELGEVAVTDCNGDGKDDLLVGDGGGVAVLLGRAGGPPTAGARVPSLEGARDVLVGDWDGDGTPDLAVQGPYDLFTVHRGRGACAFEPGARAYATLSTGTRIARGDLDKDGKQDLILAGNSLGIAYGRGDGSFRAAPVLLGDKIPQGLAAADLTGDGKIDLAVGRQGDAAIDLWPGRGDGSFAAPARIAVGAEVGRLLAADVTGDGKPDLVVGTTGSQTIILKGEGGGRFAAPRAFRGGLAVAVLDASGDGKPDVVSAGPDGLVVLAADGAGGFTEGAPFGPRAFYWELSACDLDRDGKLDLVGGPWRGAEVSVLRNQGGLAMPVTYRHEGSLWSLRCADLDEDGRPDAVVQYEDGSGLGVLPGKGDGTLGAVRKQAMPSLGEQRYRAFLLEDLSGDGKLDLFSSAGGYGYLQLFRGLGGGALGERKLFPATWPTEAVSADVNGDGRPDLLLAKGPDTGDNRGYVAVLVNASR